MADSVCHSLPNFQFHYKLKFCQTQTSDYLKQIIFLKSFNSVLDMCLSYDIAEDLDLILKERRLRWYGHVERSNGAVKTAFDIQVNGKRGPGRPKMTWKQLTERDRREWKLSAIDPHDRDTWRSGVRSAMRAASQLPGRGPTVVDMAPIPAR